MYLERRGAVGLAQRIWVRATRRGETRQEIEEQGGVPATGVSA